MTKSRIVQSATFLDSLGDFFGNRWKLLDQWEVLFSPGEDPHFYIVASGSLSILRTTPLGEKKEVGRAYVGELIGEGVLFGRNTKDVEVIACTRNTSVIPLTKADIDEMNEKNPEKVAALYRYIIEMTSVRLRDTSHELALVYEMSEQIHEFSSAGSPWLKNIVDYMTNALKIGYILYVEKHPLVADMLIYKYSSKFPSVRPINRIVDAELRVNMPEWEIAPNEAILGVSPKDFIHLMPLESNGQLRGYLLLGMKERKDLDDAKLRILHNLSPLLASIIENQQEQSVKNTSARAEISF